MIRLDTGATCVINIDSRYSIRHNHSSIQYRRQMVVRSGHRVWVIANNPLSTNIWEFIHTIKPFSMRHVFYLDGECNIYRFGPLGSSMILVSHPNRNQMSLLDLKLSTLNLVPLVVPPLSRELVQQHVFDPNFMTTGQWLPIISSNKSIECPSVREIRLLCRSNVYSIIDRHCKDIAKSIEHVFMHGNDNTLRTMPTDSKSLSTSTTLTTSMDSKSSELPSMLTMPTRLEIIVNIDDIDNINGFEIIRTPINPTNDQDTNDCMHRRFASKLFVASDSNTRVNGNQVQTRPMQCADWSKNNG